MGNRVGVKFGVALVGLALALATVGGTARADRPADEDQVERSIIFSGEENRLNAYDSLSGDKQTVIPSHADDPVNGKDINAQICFDPRHPRRFIAGEDTNQPDPPQGWGYFELGGSRVGNLSAEQLGKLTPTYQGSLANAENYGCGFLSDGRLVTADVGDQQPFTPATGQLIVWFPPFDSFEVSYCKVDVAIATAGGIHVDDEDRVYVASSRPSAPYGSDLGGVFRYDGPLPTSDDAAGGCGRTDATGAPLADEDRIGKTTFIEPGPPGAGATTPSAIAPAPDGGYYVSSVFTGVIAEYDASGAFVRNVLGPGVGVPPYDTGTPYGIGVDREGTIYYADIGVVLGPPPGPGDHNGSLRRIRFVDGQPQAPEIMDSGLAFPDGIGIYAGGKAPKPSPSPSPSPDGHASVAGEVDVEAASVASSTGGTLAATGGSSRPAAVAAAVLALALAVGALVHKSRSG